MSRENAAERQPLPAIFRFYRVYGGNAYAHPGTPSAQAPVAARALEHVHYRRVFGVGGEVHAATASELNTGCSWKPLSLTKGGDGRGFGQLFRSALLKIKKIFVIFMSAPHSLCRFRRVFAFFFFASDFDTAHALKPGEHLKNRRK